MPENCPIHGPTGRKGDCEQCLAQGKNIILCDEHGYQHVEANNCILCASQGQIRGRIVKKATGPNPRTGRWPTDFKPR